MTTTTKAKTDPQEANSAEQITPFDAFEAPVSAGVMAGFAREVLRRLEALEGDQAIDDLIRRFDDHNCHVGDLFGRQRRAHNQLVSRVDKMDVLAWEAIETEKPWLPGASSQWVDEVNNKIDALTQKTQGNAAAVADMATLLDDARGCIDRQKNMIVDYGRQFNTLRQHVGQQVTRINALEKRADDLADYISEPGGLAVSLSGRIRALELAVEGAVELGDTIDLANEAVASGEQIDDAKPAAGLEPDGLDRMTTTGIEADAPAGDDLDGIEPVTTGEPSDDDGPAWRHVDAERWRRVCEVSRLILIGDLRISGQPKQTQAILSLVLENVPDLTTKIEQWPPRSRRRACEWAAALHMFHNQPDDLQNLPPTKPSVLQGLNKEIIITPADLERWGK